jgi:spore coat polysaccharide biosynthesis predicted glycosyltransferase SpsG
VIITDGNSTLGMGHVYQSLTLADALLQVEKINAAITFITKSEKPIVDLIEKRGFQAIYLQNDDLIFDKLKELKPDRIIFDKLDVAPDLAKNIKEKLGIKLTIFTNLTEANNFADIRVMAGMGSDFKNIYERNTVYNNIEFWGPKYWLLRPEFYSYKAKPFTGDVTKIMLIFGGSDQANLSSLVLDELMRMDKKFHVNVILGAAFSHHQELNEVIKKNADSKSSVEISKSLVEVAATMYANDLVFVSPGLSFFEAIAVSTPVLCFHQNEFQENAWKGHIKTYDKSETSLIPDLINNKKFIFHDDEDISRMEIGKGISEIINEILK